MTDLLQRIEKNQGLAIGMLMLMSAFFFIGLGNVHLFDWDEINFAESAREMIATGDYMRVQIDFMPFWEKPPLFFWLQVLAMKIFGVNEFAARLPNALFGCMYLFSFYYIGRKHFSASFGLLWALVFWGSLLPHMYFKSGIIDPVFNLFIFLSVYFTMLSFGQQQGKNKNAFAAGIFSGLSVLTKGPVGLLLLLLTALVFLAIKRFKHFPTITSLLIFITGFTLVTFSWLSVELYQNGTAVMSKFIDYQLALFNTPVAGHGQPFYYHFVVLLIGCFPISIIGIPYLLRSKINTPNHFHLWMQSLFWVVLILFSITTTKIVHYSSMCYIPLAFLATVSIFKTIENKQPLNKFISFGILFIGGIWVFLLTALPILLSQKHILYPYIQDEVALQAIKDNASFSGLESIAGFILLAGILAFYYLQKKNKPMYGVAAVSLSASACLLVLNFLLLPKIEPISQGSAIEFFKSIRHENAYVETIGYKSYAHFFYAEVKPSTNNMRRNTQWLLEGEIDKPVYLISKVNNDSIEAYPQFRLIKSEGGFKMYKRMPE